VCTNGDTNGGTNGCTNGDTNGVEMACTNGRGWRARVGSHGAQMACNSWVVWWAICVGDMKKNVPECWSECSGMFGSIGIKVINHLPSQKSEHQSFLEFYSNVMVWLWCVPFARIY
jgi:hypothetical protein